MHYLGFRFVCPKGHVSMDPYGAESRKGIRPEDFRFRRCGEACDTISMGVPYGVQAVTIPGPLA